VKGSLAILGPGTLGLSTAQWAAECGLETWLLGRNLEHAQTGVDEVHRRWDRSLSTGRLSPEARDRYLGKLRAAPFSASTLEGASALIEVLPEDPNLKIPVLTSAALWGDPDLLLLTGTSSLPISDLAVRSGSTGRLVGFHLFVPVTRMAVVEMAVPAGTAQIWVDAAKNLASALQKRVVQVRDQPGFAAARMALAQGLEAMRLLEAGVATAEDLDALMTLGYGHPIGPLELSDRVGLDLRLRIAEGLTASGEDRFQPPSQLRMKVDGQATGMKAGQGFYAWDAHGRRV
jgi:3-hydroxybutyryl-CoA dehydrogenase